MLTKRLIGTVPVLNGIVVQSFQFSRYLPVGRPEIAVEFLNQWGIDEILLIDIGASRTQSTIDTEMVKRCAKYCQVPLTVGGGICSLEHMETLISSGADKITISSALDKTPELLTKGAKLFGDQCIVACLDVKRKADQEYTVCTHSGTQETDSTPVQMAAKTQELGAGEVLLNSIDRDGMKCGYDLDLAQAVIDKTDIPVVLLGGVGSPDHILDAMRKDVSGLAVGNMFHFMEHSVTVCKQHLKRQGAPIRLDSYVTYDDNKLDDETRLSRHPEKFLDHLRFEYTPEEKI